MNTSVSHTHRQPAPTSASRRSVSPLSSRGFAAKATPAPATRVYGWHFVRPDRTLAYSGEPVEVGRTYRVDPPLMLCERGLHGSLRLIDALGYAPSSILTRCAYGGEIIHGDDKLVASERTVLWMGDVGPILHEFACWCAEGALRLVEHPDPRSIAAIAAKRAWLRGEMTKEELVAARAAAEAATWAAKAAARAAARAAEAAARAAARAAEAAAWAAEAAAEAAARAARAAAGAARAAAGAAAGDARDEARNAQNDWLDCAVREFALEGPQGPHGPRGSAAGAAPEDRK